jgi:hypothetical protein
VRRLIFTLAGVVAALMLLEMAIALGRRLYTSFAG